MCPMDVGVCFFGVRTPQTRILYGKMGCLFGAYLGVCLGVYVVVYVGVHLGAPWGSENDTTLQRNACFINLSEQMNGKSDQVMWCRSDVEKVRPIGSTCQCLCLCRCVCL